MRAYFKDSRVMAHCSLLVLLLLMLLKFNSSTQVAARTVGGQRFHHQQQQQQQLQQQEHLRNQRLHGSARTAIALPIWRTIYAAAAAEHDVEGSRDFVTGTDTATAADVSKRRHVATDDDDDDNGDDDDDIDIDNVDGDDDDDDYDDNLQNYAVHTVRADENGEENDEFVYIKPRPKPAHRSSLFRSRLIALNAQATTPAPLLGRNVDTPTQSRDESRTFFKHKGQMGPQFIVLTTPLNLTNINNNNITTAATTTPAPGRRIAYVDDGYAPTGLYRSPILRSTFRRRAQSDSPALPYGLLSTWDDSAQVLPLAAAAAIMQGGSDLRYVPLDLHRLSAAQAQAQAQVASSGYGSTVGGSNDGSVDDDDFGNALDTTNAGYSRIGARWRNNPNRLNTNHRNVYESSNPFAAFTNTFRRVQYL